MRPATFAIGLAILFATVLSDSLLRLPIQSSDSLELILAAQQAPSVAAALADTLRSSGYLRPMFRAQNKLIFDLAGESALQPAYRGVHAFMVAACLVLFAGAVRVRSSSDLAAFTVAVGVLLGLHTFRGAVGEAYPVNHYLNVADVCLLTLVLARAPHRSAVDAVAVVGFLYAVLILETGVLVWVIALTAWTTGWRGISGRGLTAMSLILTGYVILRFATLPTALPTLSERSTGFLFRALDPPELNGRFGEQPIVLYAYNVATSLLSVLASEPRAGRLVAIGAWFDGKLTPHMIIMVATSTLTTAGIAVLALRACQRRALDDDTRLVAVAGAVLVANAVVSFPYTKDEIMLPAGIFYALAAYAGVRRFLEECGRGKQPHARVAVAAVMVAVSAGWAVRAAGVPYFLRSQAFKQRGDWAELAEKLPSTIESAHTEPARRLIQRLRDDALARSTPNPHFEPRWQGMLWDE